MKKIFSLLVFIISGLTLAQQVNAQSESTTQDTKENKTQFKLGVFYNSNLNYYGRTDSLRSSGVFPLAELWLSKNFYINAAPVFVNNDISSFEYAGTVATAGFQARSENQKFFSHLYFTKPLYKDNSQLVQSALKAQVSSSFSWMNKILNLNFGGDIKFSNRMDYGLSAGADHLQRFDLPGQVVLVFDPSVYIYAGTQQFTKTYYEKNSFFIFPGTEQQVTKEVSQLNILSYEFSMPVIIAKNKLQVIFNPAYVIPQNLITVQNRPDLTERGQNMFYITLGAKVTF